MRGRREEAGLGALGAGLGALGAGFTRTAQWAARGLEGEVLGCFET